MKKKNNIFDDELMKKLMQHSDLKPSENLKYRIMHQIEVEQSLRYKKVKSTKPLLKSISSVVAVFYVLILALVGFSVYTGGLEALASKEFIISAACISLPCAVYGLIITLDEKRYLK